MEAFWDYMLCGGVAMLPVLELRGAVPLGMSMGLPLFPVLIVSIIGNMIPVPFIILFIRAIFKWLRKRSPKLSALVEKLEAKAEKKAEIIYKYELFGLFVLVAIPLPGTGAWTGALIAALLDIRLRAAVPIIGAGVAAAGIIMCLISYGLGALI